MVSWAGFMYFWLFWNIWVETVALLWKVDMFWSVGLKNLTENCQAAWSLHSADRTHTQTYRPICLHCMSTHTHTHTTEQTSAYMKPHKQTHRYTNSYVRSRLTAALFTINVHVWGFIFVENTHEYLCMSTCRNAPNLQIKLEIKMRLWMDFYF